MLRLDVITFLKMGMSIIYERLAFKLSINFIYLKSVNDIIEVAHPMRKDIC